MSAPNAEASSSRALVKDHSRHKSHKDKHRAGSKHEHKSKDKSMEKHQKEGKEKKRKDHDRHKDPNRISNHSFEHRESRMRLSVPPKFAADWLAGVREVLDGMLMRYIPQMSGVLLAHWEHEFIDETVKIINESPYGVCDVQFRSVIWAPKIGMKLYGSHSLSSPSHLSLLFGKTFNVSIPLQHIPQDTYKFEHSDSPDDAPLSDDESDVEERDILDLSGPGTVEEVGRWRNTKTDKLVGDEGGKGIKFTVIGMQVNNHTLSLTGSLLADPTNPPPPPSPMTNMQAPLRSPSLSPEPEPVAHRPAKQARYAVDSSADNTNVSDSVPVSTAPAKRQNPTSSQPRVEEDVIDDRYLSARELKKKRKDEEKRKRDERKARKEERVLEHVQEVGAEASVTMQGVVAEDLETSTGKRKADGADKSSSKKRKV